MDWNWMLGGIRRAVMIEIIGQVGRPATEEEIEEYLNREDEMDG